MKPSYLCSMRIDKYLWAVRKFKTRSLASEMVRREKVLVNNELAKPSRIVRPGDALLIKKEGFFTSFVVKDIPVSRVGAKLVNDYITDTTPPEEAEKETFIHMVRSFDRRKGTGRPTKKERRNLDRFKEEDD